MTKSRVWLQFLLTVGCCYLSISGADAADSASQFRFELDDAVGGRLPERGWLHFDFSLNWNNEVRRVDSQTGAGPAGELRTQWLTEPAGTANILVGRDSLGGFGEFEVIARQVVADQIEADSSFTDLEITQAFVYARVYRGVRLQMGRQTFQDNRTWWYDDSLNAVRALVATDKLAVALSAGRRSANIGLRRGENAETPLHTLVFNARYRIQDDSELEVFAVQVRERGSTRNYLGLEVEGPLPSDSTGWLTAAILRGDQGPQNHAGFAVDMGLTVPFMWAADPALTLGAAWGSGDSNPDLGQNHNFEQTGLQENEHQFHRSSTFHYYGETLQPELSNLLVTTAAVTAHPTANLNLSLVHHYYAMHRKAGGAEGLGFGTEPNGQSSDLGHALDFVVGFEHGSFSLDAAVGTFLPGRAFPPGLGAAYSARLEFNFTF